MKARALSRRDLFKLGTASAAVLTHAEVQGVGKKKGPVCEEGGCCITPSGDFYNVERGNPLPYKLPQEKLREIGMVRETWQLEIITDPASNAKIERPMLRSDGTALTFDMQRTDQSDSCARERQPGDDCHAALDREDEGGQLPEGDHLKQPCRSAGARPVGRGAAA
ncbi:MAG: hypothetical protein B7Z37_27500 [Verrucomicrobia bacterium 12-59-8]|nr:MAG: hypothetical protein B7Z37_27500 [Verrucomicrobia bacterium 12-59-8]